MNIMIKHAAALLTILFLFCFGRSAISQKVDTLELNGEQYFVYPFKIRIDQHSAYFSAIKKENYSSSPAVDELDMMIEMASEELSNRDKRELKRMLKKTGVYSRKMNRRYRDEYPRKFLKAVRQNPYPLLEPRYDLREDVIPSLDPIPDGKYVQLFEGFCLLDAKGECTYVEDKVAAYFTIKNNVLDGYACWLNLQGDTLKSGYFKDGLKDGVWRLEEHRIGYSISKSDIERYTELGAPDADTTIIIQEYSNGAEHGHYEYYVDSKYPLEEGEFTNGDRSGQWIFRKISYDYVGFKRIRNRNNEVITKSYTLSSDEDTAVVRVPWIRASLVRRYGYDNEKFNFMSFYELPSLPDNMYRINFEKEEDLDLEEESYLSYGMDEYDEFGGHIRRSIEDYDWGGSSYGSYGKSMYDSKTDRYVERGYLIDSIGAIANYKGEYIRRYPNGQLAYKYVFEDGALVKEDTVFWDNGTPHDVIAFNADSNYYERYIYDYDGNLFKTLIYDTLGDFDKIQYEDDGVKYIYLDGLKAVIGNNSNFIRYDVYDTLDYELTEPLVLFQSWNLEDTTKLFCAAYDPNERLLSRVNYSILGDSAIVAKRMFTEDYSSWTGSNRYKIGNMELVTTCSGAIYEFETVDDTLPQRHVQKAYGDYDVAEHYALLFNGEEYNGMVTLDFGKKRFKAGKKDLSFRMQTIGDSDDYMAKIISAYKEDGKIIDPYVLSYIDSKDKEMNISKEVFNDFFKDLLEGAFYFPSHDRYSYDYYTGKKKKSKARRTVRIEGRIVDGKPEGVWTSYDQFNKVIKEVPYKDGMIHGMVKHFEYAEPMEDDDELWHFMNPLRDSLPLKKTYYLSKSEEYKNGMEDGITRSYTWYNEVTSEMQYAEGMLDGPAFERNMLAYTRMSYDHGLLDGYVQTYLTLPKQDSILLFDLNFQDGRLQGESKSYHLNGNISKRGFFLDGEPIEDYEAFDSLGFRYHYVKFEYSFPVEEKIWEENQLSVRYQFDWKDSIHFEPVDITTSQSLERLIYKMGLGGFAMELPYYGRPTLVSKRGVRFHMTKYYPNDTIARDGELDAGKKIGCWKYYSYEGEKLYEVEYKDSIIKLNDSIKFRSKGILYDFNKEGDLLYKAHIIEKSEKYDCSHTDHYEVRQLYTIWEADDSLGRMNGYVKNYYDNGVLQNEGQMKDGLPVGVWKYYDPFGQLNKVGEYVMGKRNGRWLSGDLSKTKYLGDICLNPNMPNLEEEIKYRENLLDITIINYHLGKVLNSQYYDLDMNQFIDEEATEEEVLIEED